MKGYHQLPPRGEDDDCDLVIVANDPSRAKDMCAKASKVDVHDKSDSGPYLTTRTNYGVACHNLGEVHATGILDQDLPLAVSYYEKGCSADIPMSCFALAKLYKSGKGVTMDSEKASAYEEKGERLAAENEAIRAARRAELEDTISFMQDRAAKKNSRKRSCLSSCNARADRCVSSCAGDSSCTANCVQASRRCISGCN